ncbi:MAG: lipocalin-like domain-containing protein [Stellaceae bacterium]
MNQPVRGDHPIVGTWRLTSFTEVNRDTGAISYPLGGEPNAMVTYAADGYAATIFTSTDRQPPAVAQATDEEAIRLFRSMVAFAGRYELDGDKLIYRPETSWNEAWNGTTQERLFEIDGDCLRVRSAPALSTLTGARTGLLAGVEPHQMIKPAPPWAWADAVRW